MAVARLKLANPQPLVSLKHHRFQIAFMQARRMRVCPGGHQWTFVYDGKVPNLACPICGKASQRGFRFYLLRAGRRGGKTRIGSLASIEESTIPNVWGWCCAPTYPMLEDYVLPAFFKQIPQSWLDDPRTDWSESEYTLILPNRTVVQFRSLEDPERGRGPGLHFLWLDEINLLTLRHWETIRPTLGDHLGVMFGTSTPRGEDWVHEKFFERAEQGRPGYWAAHYASIENPGFHAEDFAEAQESMTELMFRQEYLAEIVTFTGAIYGDIISPCIIEGTEQEMKHYFPEWPNLDRSRQSITGIDPGTDHPFAGVHLVASPRGLVLVGDYEQRSKPYQLHASGINDMRMGFTSRIGIDRSQAQAQIELAQYGMFTVAAENDVVAGINRVSAWMLKSKTRIEGLPAGLVLPKSLVPTTIKRLRAYRWAESEQKDGSTKQRELVFKKNDDIPDALRYALMTYPVLPEKDPAGKDGKSRDLSGMPANTRLEIERLRRIDAAIARSEEEDRVADIEAAGHTWPEGSMVGNYEESALGDFNL